MGHIGLGAQHFPIDLQDVCSQLSPTSRVGCSFVPSRFVPEREFDPVPESEFVVDDAKVVFDDMLGGADAFCDFPILESLGNEFDNKLFSFTGDTTFRNVRFRA